MNMAVAPFFRQALRADARSARTYLIRGGVVLLLILNLIPVQKTANLLGAPGLHLLSYIVGISAFLICLAGPMFFASVITDEKESMTLGLLKMTGLSPLSILLGKSTSQMLAAVMLLLAQVPLVVLAVALGGVSRPQIMAAYCALVAHLVFVSNLALFSSTICARGSRSAMLTSILLLGFFFGPQLGGPIVQHMVSTGTLQAGGFVSTVLGGLCKWSGKASVFHQLGVVLRTGFSGFPIEFQVLSNLGLGLFFFLFAWASFERSTREQKEAAPARGLTFRRTSRLPWLSAGRAWAYALTWKDFYFLAGGKGTALVKLILLGALLGGIAFAQHMLGNPIDLEDFGSITMGMTLGLICLQLPIYHSRVLGNERKWRTLSAIMILPMPTRTIAYNKMLGCLLGLVPDLVWFSVGVACNPKAFAEGVHAVVTEPTAWYFVTQFLLLLQLAAYFSLLLRRGGLLLAFVIWFFGMNLVLPFMVTFVALSRRADEGFAVASIVVVMLAVLLHNRTLRRLERVAGLQ